MNSLETNHAENYHFTVIILMFNLNVWSTVKNIGIS